MLWLVCVLVIDCAAGVGLRCSVLVCRWFCESFCWLPSRRGVLWILFCVLFDVC